jgi:hypothetical protein
MFHRRAGAGEARLGSGSTPECGTSAASNVEAETFAGGDMDIVKLPVGQQASDESDCIRIQELEDGAFSLNGSVLFRCGDAEVAESVSLIGGDPYPSYEAAEAAGLAWAGEHCAEVLYVCRSEGVKPLPEPA